MFGGFDRWLDAMSIPQRFRFSMVATTVAIVAIIGVQVWGLTQIGALHKKAQGFSGEALAAMTLEKDFTSLHRDALGYAAEPSPETLDGLTGNLRDFYTSIADTEKALVSAEHKTTLAAIKADTDELSTILDAYVAAIKANGAAPSTAIAEKGAEIDNSIESVRDAALAAMTATAAEINQQSQTVQWLSVGVAVLFLAFITLINSRIRHTVVSTVETLTGTLSAFANGNYSVAVAGGDRTDELGVLAKAVCVLRDNSLEAIRLRGDQDLLRHAHTEELQRLGGDLEVRVGQLVGEVVQTAQALEHAANELQTMAQLVASEAEHVANGADEAGQSVQTVASATEELAASIREIASRAADVATQSNHATHNATVASERVVVLEQAASNVGSVVGFITNIADQTNLLSLNATIEAARAGEAGRGFSVVASEVKSLAQQTSSATERIGEQISAIQSSVHRAIEDISAVTEGINGLSMVSNSIASAITEQDAATAEIARAVLVAAETTQIVSNRIQEVSKAAAASEQTARSMLGEVSALSSKANGLMGEVSAFVQQIRRA